MSLTNLYIGLPAGWGFGVAVTASILSYAIWTSLLKIGLARMPTILENKTKLFLTGDMNRDERA